MPNWCENTLMVTGAAEDVRRFRDRARSAGPLLSFAAFLPEPDYSDPTLQEKDWWPTPGSPLPVWYAWRLVHWGPKWDVDESSLRLEEDRKLVYTFATPYGPPLPWMDSVAAGHPALGFALDYHEIMVNFRGRQVYAGGEWQEGHEGQYYEFCEGCGAEYVLPFPDQPSRDEMPWCGQCVQGHELVGPV